MPQILWKSLSIEDVYLGFYDGPHATPEPATEGPIFLGIKNITEDGRLDLSEIRHISEKDFPAWTKRVQPRPGDIVFTYEATLNRYAIIPQGFRGCLGRRLALIRPNPNVVETKFLFYYFFGEDWRKTVASKMILGSTVDRIPLVSFPKFEINLPPLPIQRAIASILSAYDDLIENNIRRIAILEQMARMLYEEWFVKFRFPGHEQVKMVESELGMIPEGWKVRSIGEVIKYQIGGGWGNDRENDVHQCPGYVIRGTDIPDARYMAIDDCPLRYHKKPNIASRKLQSEDIVFEVSGGSKGQPVGRALFVSSQLLKGFDKDVICASFCKLLRVNRELLLPYLIYLHLARIYSNGQINKYQVQSTGITNFKFEHFLHDEKVLVPAIIFQKKFESLVMYIFDSIQNLGTRNINLRRTRDLLLPKLISGEIDVSSWVEGEVGVEEPLAVAAKDLAVVRERVSDTPIDVGSLEQHSLWG
jgi:type I restriction enzyme S subunit